MGVTHQERRANQRGGGWRRRSGRAVACTAAMALLAAAGCGGDDGGGDDAGAGGSTPASGEPFVIGYTTDLSGPVSFLGKPDHAGLVAYIEALNARGGVNGRQVDLRVLDDRSDVPTGGVNYKSMVDDGAVGVFGFLLSQLWNAAAPLAAEEEVSQVALATVDGLVDPVQPYLFTSDLSLGGAAALQVEFGQQLLEDHTGPVNAALFTIDSAAAENFRNGAVANAEEAGWTIGETQVVGLTATDVSGQAASIASSDPDIVLMMITDAAAPLAAAGLRQRGVTAPIINYFGGAGEPTLERLNDPDFYVQRSYIWPTDPTEPKAAEMQENASKAGVPGDEGSFFTHGYIQGMIIEAALTRCSAECNGPAFRDALESISDLDTEGLSGPIGVSPDDHRFLESGRFYRWDAEEGHSVAMTDWLAVPE